MELSIIIINYNTFELTCNCIQSIIDQTKGLTYEIILIDNGSKECDPNQFLKKFKDIKLVCSEDNIGFAKGNNLGIQNSSGDYILLLNSDTIIVENAIQKSFSKLKKHIEVGVLTCKLVFPDGRIQKQCRRFETISLTLLEKLRLHKLLSKKLRAKTLLNGYFNHEEEMYVDRIWGTFFLFEKKLLKLLPKNQLSDRFFMYGEDSEWCYQVRKIAKLKVLYYPETKVIHLMGGSRFGSSVSKEKQAIIDKNRKIYLSEYYGKIKTEFMFFIKKL